jgi:hypothetical protein
MRDVYVIGAYTTAFKKHLGLWEQSAGHHKQARTRMGYTDRYSCAAVPT